MATSGLVKEHSDANRCKAGREGTDGDKTQVFVKSARSEMLSHDFRVSGLSVAELHGPRKTLAV